MCEASVVELPRVSEPLLAHVSRRCLALPETELTSDRYAHAFRIRRKPFAYLFAAIDPDGREIAMLVCQADPDERAALVATGHPFFAPQSGRDRVGVVLDDATDWSEIEELVTESYRRLAPKKLVALIDPH